MSPPSTFAASERKPSEPSVLPSSFSEQERDQIVQAIRGKAEETIAHLQQDVFRLIDQAGPAAGTLTQPGSSQSSPNAQADQPAVTWDSESGRPGALSDDHQGATLQAVRLEIERLNLPEVVRGEVRRQMQAFAEQLQERMKINQAATKKVAPLSSRRRR